MIVNCECGTSVKVSINDKRGFVCDVCNSLFDVDSNGLVIRSPLERVRVIEDGVRYATDPPGRFVTNSYIK